jgi:cytochrome b
MTAQSESTYVRVWDPFVRIFHWTLASAFLIAYLTEDDWFTVHRLAGYAAVALIAMRIIWGFVGTRHARFSAFIVGPTQVLRYLKGFATARPVHYLGHNPAGGVMIVLLMAALLLTAGTGMLLAAPDGYGPFAGTALAGLDHEIVEEVHEVAANLTLLLVLVHIGGVLVASLVHRENLVRAMITGRKWTPTGHGDVHAARTAGHGNVHAPPAAHGDVHAPSTAVAAPAESAPRPAIDAGLDPS